MDLRFAGRRIKKKEESAPPGPTTPLTPAPVTQTPAAKKSRLICSPTDLYEATQRVVVKIDSADTTESPFKGARRMAEICRHCLADVAARVARVRGASSVLWVSGTAVVPRCYNQFLRPGLEVQF